MIKRYYFYAYETKGQQSYRILFTKSWLKKPIMGVYGNIEANIKSEIGDESFVLTAFNRIK